MGVMAVWLKTRPRGAKDFAMDDEEGVEPPLDDEHPEAQKRRRCFMGVGSYTRNNAELLILGARTPEGHEMARHIIHTRESQRKAVVL